jgi:hypothetical protein
MNSEKKKNSRCGMALLARGSLGILLRQPGKVLGSILGVAPASLAGPGRASEDTGCRLHWGLPALVGGSLALPASGRSSHRRTVATAALAEDDDPLAGSQFYDDLQQHEDRLKRPLAALAESRPIESLQDVADTMRHGPLHAGFSIFLALRPPNPLFKSHVLPNLGYFIHRIRHSSEIAVHISLQMFREVLALPASVLHQVHISMMLKAVRGKFDAALLEGRPMELIPQDIIFFVRDVIGKLAEIRSAASGGIAPSSPDTAADLVRLECLASGPGAGLELLIQLREAGNGDSFKLDAQAYAELVQCYSPESDIGPLDAYAGDLQGQRIFRLLCAEVKLAQKTFQIAMPHLYGVLLEAAAARREWAILNDFMDLMQMRRMVPPQHACHRVLRELAASGNASKIPEFLQRAFGMGIKRSDECFTALITSLCGMEDHDAVLVAFAGLEGLSRSLSPDAAKAVMRSMLARDRATEALDVFDRFNLKFYLTQDTDVVHLLIEAKARCAMHTDVIALYETLLMTPSSEVGESSGSLVYPDYPLLL